MESYTFGSFPCAVILVDKISKLNDLHLRKRVSRFFHEFYKGINQADLMCDPRVKIRFLELWRDEFLSKINFDYSVDSYVQNVTVTIFKEAYRKAISERKESRKKELAKMSNR